MISYLAGLSISLVVFPTVYELQRKKLKSQQKIIQKIVAEIRENLNGQLSTYFSKNDLYLNIRIFLPKQWYLRWIDWINGRRKYFRMHNFNGLYEIELSG